MSKENPSHQNMRPLDWVVQHAGQIAAPGHVLDVACGRGRHTRYLLSLGYRVTALDRDTGALSDLAGCPNLRIMENDLEDGSPWPVAGEVFEGIVVSNYLYRPLYDALVNALATGGLLIYQTFSDGNAAYGRPRNPNFLLRENELLDVFSQRLTVLDFDQGYTDYPSPAVIQKICCRKQEG